MAFHLHLRRDFDGVEIMGPVQQKRKQKAKTPSGPNPSEKATDVKRVKQQLDWFASGFQSGNKVDGRNPAPL